MTSRHMPLGFVAALILSLIVGFPASSAHAGRSSSAKPAVKGKRAHGKTRARKRVRSRTRVRKPGSRLARRLGTANKARRAKPQSPVSRRKVAKRRPEVAFRRAMDAARKRGGLILDVGGEGAHAGAVNVNPGNLTSTTGKPGRPIPNLVNGIVESIPFATGSASVVIVENTPIRPTAPAELARVLGKGGLIKLSHPADYAKTTHGLVVEATRGSAISRTAEGITTTVISVP